MDELDETQLHAGLIYVLAECAPCAARFAVAPNPFIPDQWSFYERDQAPRGLSHVCCGGLLCAQGHDLIVTLKQAVLTQAGEWLNVDVHDGQPVLN